MQSSGNYKVILQPISFKVNAKVENAHNFLKWTLITFLVCSDLEWDELLPFACYCYSTYHGSNITKSLFFPMLGWYPVEGRLTHLNNINRYY